MKYVIGFGAFALILTIFGLVGSTANASSQLYSQTYSSTDARWHDTFVLPKADPARGKLVSVVVQVAGNMKSEARFASVDLEADEVAIDFDGFIQLYEPRDPHMAQIAGSATPLLTVVPEASIKEQIEPNVGRALFKTKRAATTAESVGTATETLRLTDPSSLQSFQGNGVIELSLKGGIDAEFVTGNKLSTYLNGTMITEVAVEYIYASR